MFLSKSIKTKTLENNDVISYFVNRIIFKNIIILLSHWCWQSSAVNNIRYIILFEK